MKKKKENKKTLKMSGIFVGISLSKGNVQNFEQKKKKNKRLENLTHFSQASHKRDSVKQLRPRSDAAEPGVLSGSLLFEISTGISI